jgi:hypothetical protein
MLYTIYKQGTKKLSSATHYVAGRPPARDSSQGLPCLCVRNTSGVNLLKVDGPGQVGRRSAVASTQSGARSDNLAAYSLGAMATIRFHKFFRDLISFRRFSVYYIFLSHSLLIPSLAFSLLSPESESRNCNCLSQWIAKQRRLTSARSMTLRA